MSTASTTQFDLDRVRNLRGRTAHVWYRRLALLVMLAVVVAALAGVFGQTTSVRSASSDAATLEVRAPSKVRGGLLWPARITIRANQKLVSPTLVLNAGWVEGMQVNTIAPSPTAETTRPAPPGEQAPLAFTYPTLEAGDELTLYLQLQTDPSTAGNQPLGVALESANAGRVALPGTLLVFP